MSRRERVRETTLAEIKTTARRHLTEHGPSGVSLRGIARDMGMTAPGLYRYFASLSDLLLALQADFFTELAEAVRGASETVPEDDLDGRILAALRAFRSWAVANESEFTLLFGPPSHEHAGCPHEGEALAASQAFSAMFFTLFDQLLEEERFPVPPESELPPELTERLLAFAEHTGFRSPNVSPGAMRVLVACWVRLYGLVSMEVFRHLTFVMDDMRPMFEAELGAILATVGVRYRPPDDGDLPRQAGPGRR
ncbi:TetR/AcrR family transcriptional regulator [Marinitenerispora sediminis]|uniref:TetR family transcriptional regulator n=1 Tax=Marinitenerispora sediminis TaxID=1931232 RepID=A0A368T7S8_9ACTN|nr:TetR family transcriptional regulator [Marinitenerispora sediminis]RCV60225.1 TetR family transcriptional regulator [Marinitenerispora sediminis]RCV62207.1 TetR family transcriptional regulator [Marinitenerispora sediminis]